MRCRGSVVVIASFLASSLMLAPAQLADALADAPNCLEFISRTSTLSAPDGPSYGGPISADGRYVLFASEATNLGPTDTNGAIRDVFVRDTVTGALDLVSQSTAGTQTLSPSDPVAISSDGRFVLFTSSGALVDPDPDGLRDLFVRDRLNGVTTRVSTNADSTSLGGVSIDAGLSNDGRYVFYVTPQSYVAADTNGVADVYRFDTVTSGRTLVSVADDESPLTLGADGVSVSGDGNLVLFHSGSIGAPGVRVAAVRDIAAGTTRTIGAGNGRVSADGHYAALLATTGLSVTDLQTNTVETIDANGWGIPVAVDQKLFDFSPTGRYLLVGQGAAAPYQFFVVDRVGHVSFKAGPDDGALAYVGEGALVSSTSATAQAYVWRGPLSVVSTFSPASVDQGAAVEVTLTGSNLIPGTTFDFGPGVSVSNFVFVSLLQAKVTLTVAAGATPGSRAVGVNASSGCVTSVGGFAITAAVPPTTTSTTTSTTTTTLPTTTTSSTTTTSTTLPTTTTVPTTTVPVGPPPSASSVTPALVRPGQNRSISITGTNFAQGATVTVDGVGVFATAFVDAQHLFAVLSVPASVDGVHAARVTNPNGLADSAPPTFVVRGSEGEFHSMQPYRAFDSRSTQAVSGERTIQLANLPSSGVRAVAANLTVTGATTDSYLTTFAAGTPRPNASSINFRAGETKANMVTLPVNAQGQLVVYNFAGSVDVIIDVVGWYSDANTTFGSVFMGGDPFRRLDTRIDRNAPLGPGESMSVPIVGTNSSVSAVMLNVTVTGATEASYLTVWPTGTPQPYTSNINYVAGDTVPNVVIVPVGAGGAVNFFNSAGDAHVIVDVLGVFEAGASPYLGGRFVSSTPTRALDTRLGTGGAATALAEHSSLILDVRHAGVPSDATAVVMNVTVAAPSFGGYLTVWPAGGAMPDSSNLNFSAGQVTANLVVVPLGPDGGVGFFNAFGSTPVIADVVGYYR